MTRKAAVELILSANLNDKIYDGVILISHSVDAIQAYGQLKAIHTHLLEYSKAFTNIESGKATHILHDSLPYKRLIYTATGSVDGDFDDVRRYLEAGKTAIISALSAGLKLPLIIVVPSTKYSNACLLAVLGALHNLHVPLNIREEDLTRSSKLDGLGILNIENNDGQNFLRLLNAFQSSFMVCRDVGDTDPQRMSPGKAVEYIEDHFKHSSIKVTVESNQSTLNKEYPLLAAVSRAADNIQDHRARLIWLEYENKENSPDAEYETLYFIGKGVTLDTGGADIKTGGAMLGMSRDKYGSAVVAGLFEALDKLRPKGIKVVGAMCMVRNSIGSNAYTCDEIITSRSGKRILICNTDAEGRLAMLDPLTAVREQALNAKNPHLYTLATLTGHEVLSYGYFPSVMDNGPARQAGHAKKLQQTGDNYGQPVEISRLHIEDFDFNNSPTESADLRQGGNRPSVQTIRGHQSPGAFLIRGSRLDEHGLNSSQPIKFSHIDIGSSMGEFPQVTFPCPLLALIAHHFLPRTN